MNFCLQNSKKSTIHLLEQIYHICLFVMHFFILQIFCSINPGIFNSFEHESNAYLNGIDIILTNSHYYSNFPCHISLLLSLQTVLSFYNSYYAFFSAPQILFSASQSNSHLTIYFRLHNLILNIRQRYSNHF